jgi:hypothetical protein
MSTTARMMSSTHARFVAAVSVRTTRGFTGRGGQRAGGRAHNPRNHDLNVPTNAVAGDERHPLVVRDHL